MSRADQDESLTRGGVLRRTGRVAIWPFRGVLGAPRAHLVDNEAVWSLREWQDIASTLKPGGTDIDVEAMEDTERKWADPRNWPEAVVSYVLMNIQCAGFFFLLLMGLSFLAIARAGAGNELTDFARLSFLVGGCGGLCVSLTLYIDACLDFVRLRTFRFTFRLFDLLREPAHWWIFRGERGIAGFLQALPAHLKIGWVMQTPPGAHARAVLGVLGRVLIALALLTLPLLAIRLVSLII